MNCKNCGKEIIKVSGRWYHVKKPNWLCSTKHAEPKDDEVKKNGNS